MMKKLLLPFGASTNSSNSKLKAFRSLLMSAVLLLGGLVSVQAQNPSVIKDYSFAESTGVVPYVSIIGGTSVISGTFVDVAAFSAVPLGFTYIFNNAAYTDAYISDNGYIMFKAPIGVTALPTVGTGIGLSSATAYPGAVAGYATNALRGYAADLSDVSYITTGIAGSRVFTVQYTNMRRWDGVSASYTGLLNFQIKLYEIDNRVEVAYKGDFVPTGAGTSKGQVGLRGPSNSFNPTNGNVNNRNNTVAPLFPPTAQGTLVGDGLITKLLTGTTYGPAANALFTWAPTCFNPMNLVAALQSNNTDIIYTWDPSLYPGGVPTYQYELRSDLLAPGSPGAVATSTTTSNTVTMTSLGFGNTYKFYIRRDCRTDWVNCPFTSTQILCTTPLGIPYYQDFQSAAVGGIPNCTSVAVGPDTQMVTRDNSTGPNTPLYGFTTKNLITGGVVPYPGGSVNATNTWWFTQGITLTAGSSYKITYTYGGTREQAFFTQKLRVAYGATASAAGMSVILSNNNNIKTSPNTTSLNFTAGATGTFYFGFNAYAGTNNGYLQIDDISILASTCFPPTALAANQITANAANISWTPSVSSPNPSGGYDYYVSTASTPTPTGITIPTGSVAAGNVLAGLTGLSASTPYNFWVRSSCGGGDSSEWSAIGSFTTIANPCTPAPTSVDSQGITNVTFGLINNTTGDEPGHYGDYSAQSAYVSQTASANISLTYSITGTIGGYATRIWVDWNNDGDFYDVGEEVYYSGAELPNGTSLISFVVPISVGGVANTAGPHRMRIGGADLNDLSGIAAGQGPCYNGSFGTFEDYTIYVTPPPPPLNISSNSYMMCSGNTTPTINVTSTLGNFDNYSWTPVDAYVVGSLATGWTFNPPTNTTYTLTATKLIAGILTVNTATYAITVNPSPTPITITATPTSYCQGDAPVKLVAAGGIISGAVIYSENFNGGTNTFTLVHSSTGGSAGPAYGNWMLKNSPYTLASFPASPYNTDGGTVISSNDASQFYVSDSDLQGSGGTTNEELISQSFSLVGYNDANVDFWHYYKSFGNGSASVEISVNGGAWTAVPGGQWTTTNQGAPSNFVNTVLNLSTWAYPGNANNNVKIRFKYVSNWGYRWAIDNVKITGSSSFNTVWTPITELYSDALGAVPYIAGQKLATVYTRPTVNRTYTATASTLAPVCPASANITVNFNALSGGGVLPLNQLVSCGSPAAPITVSAYLPAGSASITGWEYSYDNFGTPGVFIPGSVGLDVLTPALIGSISTDTYFRAIITGCNVKTSTIAHVGVTGFNTWNGFAWSGGAPTSGTAAIVTGPLVIASDLSLCSLQVLSGGAVTVNAGVTLTVENAVSVAAAGASLTFEDGSSLLQSTTATTNLNSGNIVYKRDSRPMRKYDYTYWSAPVSGQLLSQSATGIFLSTLGVPLPMQPDKYYYFDTTSYAWAAPLTGTMNVGMGYIIRAPLTNDPVSASTVTATFMGKPNNGTYAVNVVKTGINDLNCIGNPYPSAISADAFVLQNAAAFTSTISPFPVGTTFYFWTHNSPINASLQYVFSDYAVYNSTGATGSGTPSLGPINSSTPTGIIGAGQSFMVKGIIPGTRSVNFTNSMRSGGTDNDITHFFRNANTNTDAKSRIWLDLTNEAGAYKQILVGYVPNATNDYENGYDGDAIEVENPVSLYSIVADKNLTIQGRALPFEITDQVPLGLKSPEVGTYTITRSKVDGLFAEENNIVVYLEDTMLNVMHNLNESPYTFVTEAGTFDTRFVLRYSDTNLAINPAVLNENGVIAFKQNDAIHVETATIKMQSVKVFDSRGRLILAQDHINSNGTKFTSPGIANQVLMIQVTSEDGITVTKKIIF